MAKKRDDVSPGIGDTIERVPEVVVAGEPAGLDELAAENDALANANRSLEAEIVALRREIVAMKSRAMGGEPVAQSPRRFDGPLGKYLVKLQDAPSWVVEALSEAHAWPEYCRAAGVIASDHQPVIVATDLPVGRHYPAASEQLVGV